MSVESVFDRIRTHEFHPLDERNFTIDRELGEDGIADLDDEDWLVRLLAVRDLIRLGEAAIEELITGLSDDDLHVRYVAAKVLGVLGASTAIDPLEQVAQSDPYSVNRSEAVIALGRMGAAEVTDSLHELKEGDDSKDVRHQAELALDRIEKGQTVEMALEQAYHDLDPDTFEQLTVGELAPSFSLPDTDEQRWALDDHIGGDEWTVLVWVFADWCPVCHREFDELIELRQELDQANITLATIECHDRYQCRVMVGRELEPEYWFAEESFAEQYRDRIWWPHLVDRGGAVGATYGVDPLAFSVHSEYINRPAAIVIDPDGIVRFAYYGTFWGDRLSIEDLLEMVQEESFTFEHPDRRVLPGD